MHVELKHSTPCPVVENYVCAKSEGVYSKSERGPVLNHAVEDDTPQRSLARKPIIKKPMSVRVGQGVPSLLTERLPYLQVRLHVCLLGETGSQGGQCTRWRGHRPSWRRALRSRAQGASS